MQFDSGKSRRSKIFRRNFKYSSILQLYEEPPTEKVSLMEFEEYAIDRIKCKYKIHIVFHFLESSYLIIML